MDNLTQHLSVYISCLFVILNLQGWGWVGPHPLARSLPSSLHSLGCPGPADLAYSLSSPGFWRFLVLEASVAGSCLFGKFAFSVLRKGVPVGRGVPHDLWEECA